MVYVGVAGCGKIAQVRHLPEYADRPDVKIAAVYDVNYERACEVAEQYGAAACKDFNQMLEDPMIQAVSICVANAFHCEMTIAALKAGKHVLCEKPMAVTLMQCKEMVKTAKEMDRFLMIGHNQRLAKAHAAARKLIVQGEIGDIISFQTNFSHSGPETWSIDGKSSQMWFFDKEKAAFGAMADLGIHKTDLIQFLTGQKVTEVMAFMDTLEKRNQNGELIGVDDNSICLYRMTKGCIGTMKASWTCYGKEDNSTVLYGTKGVMHIYEDPQYSIIIEKKDGGRVLYEADKIQTNEDQTKSGIIDAWVDCIVNEKNPEISGEEALSAMKAVFAALESAEKGVKITVK